MIHRRSLALLVLAAALGCRGQKNAPSLGELTTTVALQIADTLLPPPSRTLSNTPPDPPLVGTQGKNQVVLTADEATFLSLLNTRLPNARFSEKDIAGTVRKVNDELNRQLKRRRVESVVAAFPPQVRESEAGRSVVATLVPYTLETGGPNDQARGKSEILLMVRLRITDPVTGQSLAQREFYSGYTLPGPR